MSPAPTPAPTTLAPDLPEWPVHGVVIEVTPELATTWLEGNTHNRPITDAHVDALARDMTAGAWRMTGDSIKFDTAGVLIDGQHRLWAVVQCGRSVTLMVVRGLDPEVQDFIDIGKKRSVSDALHLRKRGGGYAAAVAAIARGVVSVAHPSRKPTHAEVLALVECEEELLVAGARVGRQAITNGLRGGAIYGIAYYYLAHLDAVEAPAFFSALVSGESLGAGHPILALRRRFLQAPPRAGSGASHLRVNLAYIYKAWNYWRDGKQISALRYSLDEPMPVAH